MQARHAFADAISAKMNEPCPAVQNAVDRIVSGERYRGRDGMLDALRNDPNYSSVRFVASLLEAWKPEDVKIATGRDRDTWIGLNEAMKDWRA